MDGATAYADLPAAASFTVSHVVGLHEVITKSHFPTD
jgi:hypothetical protein